MAVKSVLRLIVFLMFLSAAGCAPKALLQGDEFASRGEWDEAVLRYAEIYRDEPENLDYRIKYTKARFEAAQIHFSRGEESLKKGAHEAAIMEYQAALMLDPSLDKARASVDKTKRLMDSLYYYGKGAEALKRGDEKEAKSAFKKSLVLNPGNSVAASELEKLKKPQKVVLDGFELDLKSSASITLEFKDTGIKKAFDVLSKLSGVNFVFDSDIRDDKTTLYLKDATFQQALDLILMTNKLSRKVVSENTIIVYPANQQKSAQYEELMIKVFYLSNSDAKKTVNLLRTMLKARDMVVHEELNAIVIRAKPDVIELAQKILDATDLADSEVMLTVEIMEINRNKAAKLGIDLSPDSFTAGVPTGGASPAPPGTITLNTLKGLNSGALLIGLPTAILNIKKEDLDANILANPKIRVKNNGKAKIHIGERVPIITSTVNQGVTSENVQYQDVGLKLSVEPVIRKTDDVDIKLGLEVSSLGTKIVTNSGSVAYQIGTRNTETVLRLRDGETQIFGGLINDEERTTVAKIPLLGEIPLLGRLFSNSDSNSVKTEILLSITPHILRRLEVPEDTAAGFLSGRDEYPSVRPMMEGFRAEAAQDAAQRPEPGAQSPMPPHHDPFQGGPGGTPMQPFTPPQQQPQ